MAGTRNRRVKSARRRRPRQGSRAAAAFFALGMSVAGPAALGVASAAPTDGSGPADNVAADPGPADRGAAAARESGRAPAGRAATRPLSANTDTPGSRTTITAGPTAPTLAPAAAPTPPRLLTGLLAPLQALAAAGVQRAPAAQTAKRGGAGQTAVIIRPITNPVVGYDASDNVQVGGTLNGSVSVTANGGTWTPNSRPDWAPVASGSRRANSGETSSQRGAPPAPVAPTRGTVTFNPDGTFNYTANPELAQAGGVDSFTVTVTDRYGRTTAVPITVVIRKRPEPVVGRTDPDTGAVTGRVDGGVDGSDLDFSPASEPLRGAVVVDASTGEFSYTPSEEARHAAAADDAEAADLADSFTVNISSADGTVVVPVTVAIEPVNNRPSGAQTSAGSPNAASGAVAGTVSATDADGDALTYSAPARALRGTVSIDPATGAFTYTPDAAARHAAAADDAAATDRADVFTITVDDRHGGIVELLVTVPIAPVNRPPAAPLATVGEPDSTGIVRGVVTGSDPDGDVLRFSAPAITLRGTVSIDPVSGAFTYTPSAAARESGTALSDTFTVTVNDGHGGIATVAVAVAIDPNRTPTAVVAVDSPDPATAVVTGTVTGSDPDGHVVSYSAPAAPAKGTVSVNPTTGAFVYTPSPAARHAAAADGAGLADRTDSFTVAVSDGRGGIATVAVTVDVIGSNAAPTFAPTSAAPDPATGSVSGSARGSDADGDALTYAVSAGPASGTVTLNPVSGAFTYLPDAAARHAQAAEASGGLFGGRYGQSQVVDVARSPGCAQQGGSCTVSNFQDAYVAPYTNRVRVTWAPGDYVQFVDTGSQSGGSPNVRLVQYDSAGAVKQVISANGYVQSLGTGILYIGEPSVAGGTGYFISNGLGLDRSTQSSYSYTVGVIDPGAADLAGYAASATPLAAGQEPGNDVFTITVSDGHGGFATRQITVPISPANTAPTAVVSSGAAAAATGAITGAVVGSDADGDTLRYTGPTNTARGTVTVNPDGSFTYTPTAAARHAAAAAGAAASDRTDTFEVTIADGHGGVTVQNVTLGISPGNVAPTLAPVLGAPSVSTGAVNGTAGGADADVDTLTYSIGSPPADGTVSIDPVTGAFVYTPDPAVRHAAAAERLITGGLRTITLSDPATVTQGTFSLRDQTLANISQLSSPGTNRYNYLATFFTADTTQQYVFGQTSAPVDTVLTLYTGTFDPTSPGTGAVVLNDDASVDFHSYFGATVQGPTGCGSMGYCPQIRANLTAGQVVTLVVTTYSAGAPLGLPQTFYSNGPGVFSQSSPDDSFIIEVDDGHGGVTTRRVFVPITPANNNPTATTTAGAADAATGAIAGAVLGADADGDQLTYTGTATSPRGTFTLNPDGSYLYTPTSVARHAAAAAAQSGPAATDSFTVTIRDGHGGVTTVPVTIAISPTNTNPSGGATVGTPNLANGVVTGAVIGSDADGDSLGYSAVSTTTANGGTVTVNSDGTFTYTPTAAARHAAAAPSAVNAAATILADTFYVRINDFHGGVVVLPVSVPVGPANNAPTGTVSTSASFANGNFSNGLTGWTAINSRVRTGGVDSVAGWPTPNDPTTAPDGGIEATTASGTYSSTVTNGRAVMTSGLGAPNNPAGSGSVVHGPVVVSNDALYIRSGATVQFDWEASGGSDAFDVLGYLLDVDTGATYIMLNATGANSNAVQPVTVVNIPVANAGNYKFVFMSGSWDATRGQALGARLSIDNVQVLGNFPLGGVLTGGVVGADADGDPVSYALTTQPTNGAVSFNPATGGFSYTPNNPNNPANDSFIVTITDGFGGSTPVTVTVP